MAETIAMPKLGFDMAEGTLVRWVKGEGDTINKGDVLAEIETDKATVEVEASVSGVIARLLVEKGSIVPVGTPIAVVALAGEDVAAVAAAAGSGKAEFAPAAEPAAAPAVTAAPTTAPAPAAPVAVVPSGPVIASPLARKMAADRNLDLSRIQGSGPGGRIVKRDLENPQAAPAAAPVAPIAAPAPAAKPTALPLAPLSAVSGETPADQRMPVDRLRAAIGRRMVESKQQVPHFYVTHNYNMEPLLAARKQINDLLPDDGKLSVNDFIVKAVALTLRSFPKLNASLTGNEIVLHGAVNVGVAVAVEGGLLTVVSRDADRKPLRVISAEIKEMVARARAGKVRPEDIEGSTFSISNLGMFDVEHFVAIINPPEAAILAVGSAQQVPVVEDGQIRVGTRMKATISADHRVTDGAEAAQFMQTLAAYIENPLRLLI